MTPLSEDRRERAFCGVGVRNNGTGWLFSLSPLLALSMSCARCPTPFAQQHLKLLGPPNSGRSVAEWAPSLKRATDACVLASNNASPAQRGPRRDAQPLHATPLAAVLFPAPLRARVFTNSFSSLFRTLPRITHGPSAELGIGPPQAAWRGAVEHPSGGPSAPGRRCWRLGRKRPSPFSNSGPTPLRSDAPEFGGP